MLRLSKLLTKTSNIFGITWILVIAKVLISRVKILETRQYSSWVRCIHRVVVALSNLIFQATIESVESALEN